MLTNTILIICKELDTLFQVCDVIHVRKQDELKFETFLGHFVEAIFKEAQQMNFFSFEDIFWTGIVAGQKLKMKLHDDTKFEFTYFPEQYVYKFPCLLSDYVAVHKISRTEMIETWQKLHSEKCSSLLKFISKMSERWI